MKTSASPARRCSTAWPSGFARSSEALLVAGFQHPREIVFTAGIARQVRQVAIGIACYRRLDLDHIGTEIRQHGCGCGRCDEARAVENLEAFENAVFHREVAPVSFCWSCSATWNRSSLRSEDSCRI